MKTRLAADLKQAMKENNTIKKNTIQLIRAAILQEEKDQQKSLTNQEIENLIMKEKKKRREALAQYEKARRNDLIQQTRIEISIIDNYLPQPVTDYELTEGLKVIIKDLNATPRELGQVIRKAKEKFGNSADPKRISDTVKQLLEVE